MPAAGMKLSHAFNHLLVLGCQLRDARNLGSPDALRARLLELIRKAEEEARQAGIPHDTMTHAKYALTAFLDEMVNTSGWSGKEQWAARPLQYELFGEFVAGEGFFARLDAIRRALPVQVELLEIFALCLMLGFEGQYRVQDRAPLKGLTEDVLREIQVKRGDFSQLAPHGARPEELLDLVRRELPAWVVLIISAGIVLFFYLGLSFIISQDAHAVVNELQRLLQRVKG